MDLANLDKMKVVDLRSELQSRGLDTKGVKAVLIERLRANLESGTGGVPPSPGTPGRRSRRTRSMTKSPSPSPVKKAPEPVLETLVEESTTIAEEEVNEKFSTPEKLVEKHSQEITPAKEKEAVANYRNDATYENAHEEEVKEDDNQKEDVQESHIHEEEIEEDETEELLTNGNQANEISCNDDKESENVARKTEAVETKDNVKEHISYSEEKEKTKHQDDENLKDNVEAEKDASPKKSNNRSLRERSRSTDRHDRRKRSHTDCRSKTRSRSPHKSKSDSVSPSPSPKRRSGADSLESPSKEAEDISTPEDEPTIEENQFGLSWFDSDLHLRIDPVDFISAKPMSHDIYALVWSGARTNYGVREGRVCFEVRLAEETNLNRDHPFRDEPNTKGFRVGFSLPSSNLLLGEAENSFAYCETGRKATNGDFVDFAKPFQLDDVIGCYLNLESTPCTIKYTLNGEDLGVAFEFDKAILGESLALFPHVLTKGYEYEINLADNDNLLVNKERKIRKRRKVKKIEEKKEKEEKQEDEQKTDEEKTVEGKDENSPDVKNAEQTESEEQKVEEAKPENTEEEKEETAKADEELSEKVDKEEDTNITEAEVETVEDQNKSEDASEQKAEVDKKHINKEKDEKSTNKNKEDGAPTPSKRQKLETVEEVDEYEEIHPVPRDHMSLLEDYELIALIPEDKYIPGPQRPESRKDCEVILMVGLPGAGKTTWVLNHIKENPEKRYHVIGADALISKMTIDGVSRKTVHKGRFDRIYELCFNVLTSLEDIAVKRRRNFILDQANAYASAQRRKMKGFADFKRIAVVCIPNDEEHKRRLVDKKEKGQAYTLKESTLNTLQASFTLPSLEFSWFDDIIFTDLGVDEAKEEVKKYNETGKKALDEYNSNRDKRQRRDNYRNDNRRRQDDHRRYDNRNDNRWNDRRASSGGGYYHGGGSGGGGGGNRWGGGGGYRNNSGGYRDDRGYGGGGGGYGGGGGGYGGGGRGYDNRQQRYSSGPQNWVQNNRNRYDDRSNRYSGAGGGGDNRYNSYGGGTRDYRSGGGGGDNRDNRIRNRGDNGGGGGSSNRRDSYRSGGASNQRDFRHGHRDTREDSRGGSTATSATAGSSSNHKSSSVAGSNNGGYDKYNKNKPQINNWNQYPQHQAGAVDQQQQQYWNYDMQGYSSQQQWQSMDPQQQQQWMSYWQQQGGNQQAAVSDPNQYWSQYSYNTPTDAANK